MSKKCLRKTYPTAALKPIPGLVGPNDLTIESYREYEFGQPPNRVVYRINDPVAYYWREGGSTHRVVQADGVVHCVPAPGFNGCVVRWKNRGVETGADPVTY